MKQLIILIFISTILLNAKSVTLTEADIKKINNSPNQKAIKLRLIKYIDLKKKIKNFSAEKKLNYVNTFYNKILPVNDKTKYQADDYWATPKEFLIQGKGDCEDYAISKYFTLKEAGIPQNKLFLSIVKVKNATNYHMVLTYLEDKKSIPLILDNLSFKVLPFTKRVDLESKVLFNEEEAYILKNYRLHKRARIDWGEVNKWELLLNRIYKKNE